MKIKRFFAENIRQAMQMVRDELGADAVIMSNRSVDGGVEIVAARDFDEQEVIRTMPASAISQSKSSSSAQEYIKPTISAKQVKKVALPDFEAEKNHLHVVSSPRKQEEKDKAMGRNTARRGIDQYVGYAEKVQLRGNPDAVKHHFTTPAPIPTSAPPSVMIKVPKKAAAPAQAQREAIMPQARQALRSEVGAEARDLRHLFQDDYEDDFDDIFQEETSLYTPNTKQAYVEPTATVGEQFVVDTAVSAPVVEEKENTSEKLLVQMSKEIKSLRNTFDSKLSSINFAHHLQNKDAIPVRTELLKNLAGMSISKKLSVKIANRFANHTNFDFVFTQAQELLSKVLPIAEDNLLETGGIIALVGPTGVGKTTSVAKIAAQFTIKHGPNQVALITTDNYRIAAHEQLNTYGRLLNIPVRVASSASELSHLIHSFSDKKLVLIDTAGMSQRDMKLIEQINTLKENDLMIKSYLVMSAATEYKAMNEIIDAFHIFKPHAAILTKIDEAATVGSAISSLIEHNLPISFITNGQQVPEDMRHPCARKLIAQCVTELDVVDDYSEENNEAWVAQGYA
ncbi:MAG: flagellar biosynthesis protein FlhF [Pseudomonadota bacterium]